MLSHRHPSGVCRCGKRMFQASNETCAWCGHGTVTVTREDLLIDELAHTPARLGRPRLPRDLGALQREGRYPSDRFANVVPNAA